VIINNLQLHYAHMHRHKIEPTVQLCKTCHLRLDTINQLYSNQSQEYHMKQGGKVNKQRQTAHLNRALSCAWNSAGSWLQRGSAAMLTSNLQQQQQQQQ
jgi:hypothetical protein